MLANSEQYLVIEYNKLNFANLSHFNVTQYDSCIVLG